MQKSNPFLPASLFVVACLCFCSVMAQTSGAGYVSSIESKASQIDKNDEKVGEYNRQHLQTYSDEQEKLKQLKAQLAALIKEKEDVLDELRRGRFCNGCGNTASQLRARGVYDVEDHFRQNGGTRPADPARIKQAEDQYNTRISNAQKQLDEFQKGDNEFSRKRDALSAQMNQLKASSDKLREEIVALSKSYKDAVFNEGKGLQKTWVGELLHTLAEKHYLEDRINILNVRMADLGQQESKAIAELEAKLRKKNDDDIKALNDKIAQNKMTLLTLESTYQNRIAPVNNRIANARTQLDKVKRDLLNKNLTEEAKAKLDAQQSALIADIERGEEELANYKTSYEAEVQKILAQNKTYADQAWALTTGISKIIQDETAKLKSAFESKRKIMTDALAARKLALEQTGRLLSQQETAFTAKNNEFVRKIETERVRMLSACSRSGASCYGTDAASAVVANWNKVKGCVNEMEGAHFSNDPVYGCEEESPVYTSHYRSFSSGLSDADAEALQRSQNKVRYDAILKTIRN